MLGTNLICVCNNGNAYIIPLAKNLKTCKSAISNMELKERFVYQKGKKATVIEYKDECIGNRRVLTFRDVNEAAVEQANYLRHMELGETSYTQEGFEKKQGFHGRDCTADES